MSQVDLMKLVRENIKSLKAYHVENIECEIKLHANENPYQLPDEILSLLQDDLRNTPLNRYPDPDSRGLKNIISQRLGVAEEQCVIGNGSDELIQLALQVFCDEGDAVAFPDPTFGMYAIIAKGMGLKPFAFSLDSHWDFRADDFLAEMEKQQPKIIFFSFPNNPTGNCFNQAEIQKVIEASQAIVVADEAYYDFSKKSFVLEIARHNNLIIMRSLSKIGLAGLRVGYAVADPIIIEQINKVRLPYNSNSLSQIFSEKVLRNFDPVQKQIDKIIAERERLFQALSQIKTFEVYPSDSNFILFRVQQDSGRVFQELMDNGILVRDLSAHPRLQGCLRVTVGTPEENDQFLDKIKALAG
ncbi:MAG: histidinol-phosphate transaminase [Nitrospinales bacterium]